MKFKKYLYDDYLDEEFTSPENRRDHWERHIQKRKEYDMTEEEYEKAAEDLMNTPCDYKRIFGYTSRDKETGKIGYVKYDKDTELFTVYNKQGKTVTAFRRSYRDFMGKMYDANEKFEYIDELPKGK